MPLRFRLLASPAAANAPAADGIAREPIEERAIEVADDLSEIRIGRRPDLEIPLPFPALSGLHAWVTKTDGGWQVEDLGSTNGTRVDGEKLAPGAPRAIGPGAHLTLARISLVFDGPARPVSGADGTATIARRLVNDLFAAAPAGAAPTLTVVAGVPLKPGVRLETVDRRYLAGRIETCDLTLPSEEISREHAAFVRRWDGVMVSDLGSKNGVRVNDDPVAERRLRDGDLIKLGPVILRLSDPADRYLREIEERVEATQGQTPEQIGGSSGDPARRPESPPSAAGFAGVAGNSAVAITPATSDAAGPDAPALRPTPRLDPEPRRAGARTATWVGVGVLVVLLASALWLLFGG